MSSIDKACGPIHEQIALGGETRAYFELEKETGQITLNIVNPESGEIRLRLSPDEVSRGLKGLEEADDNSSPLSCFFVNITA